MEGFGAAHLASVRVDLKQWLDLRDTGDDPSDGNQLPNGGPSDFSNSQRNITLQGSEVQGAGQNEVVEQSTNAPVASHSLSSKELWWEASLTIF